MTTQTTTQTKPSDKAEGGSCSMDKAAKATADKGTCGTQHKEGSCSSKQ